MLLLSLSVVSLFQLIEITYFSSKKKKKKRIKQEVPMHGVRQRNKGAISWKMTRDRAESVTWNVPELIM